MSNHFSLNWDVRQLSKKTKVGAGYGGDITDPSRRKQGKRKAQEQEKVTWADWQDSLWQFIRQQREQRRNNDVTNAITKDHPILDVLKKVLRCQAPNWWWKQPQRKTYLLALEVSIYLTQHRLEAWGDPDDSESAIAALEELSKTCKLLVASFKKSAASSSKEPTLQSLLEDTQKASRRTMNTNEKDSMLPTCFLTLRDTTSKALRSILETKDYCSAMGAHEYYRQKLRPMAFGMVETSFEYPRHFYAPGGGFERTLQGNWMSKLFKNIKAKARATTASSGGGSGSSKKTTTALWKELSTYPTALPIEFGSSIFVRALERDLDKLRVLIIGPEDTPYANGCFFFDVSMGNDYPNAPPKVQFLTTSSFVSLPKGWNQNKPKKKSKQSNTNEPVRFNPNLYNCGKVCLSLLGTWSGPGWTTKESTLLQVLVSLQSLVLGNPSPYFNEPGFEKHEGSKYGDTQSKNYNMDIRQKTVRVAMLPFLYNQLQGRFSDETKHDSHIASKASTNGDNPRASVGRKRKKSGTLIATSKSAIATSGQQNCYWFPEFKEVIEQHYKLKKQSIEKQLCSWLKEDPSLQDLYTEFWEAFVKVEELERQKHRSGKHRTWSVETGAITVDKNGVTGLDDDVDDYEAALQQTLANSMAAPKDNPSEVIELLDDVDEEACVDRKPAARRSIIKRHCGDQVVDLT